MLAIVRHEDIARRIREEGSVRVKELSALYGVTEDCIRKDLAALEREGLLKRTYGGAVAARPNERALGVSGRRTQNLDAKHTIALKAMEQVHDQDMIFLDISTANIELAALLARSSLHLIVVTNMLDIIPPLAESTTVRLIFLGGSLNRSADGFTGALTESQIRNYRFDTAFLGAVGANVFEDAVLTYEPEDGATKASALHASRKAFLMLEQRKFGNDGDYVYAAFEDFSGVIVDELPSDSILNKLKEYDVPLY